MKEIRKLIVLVLFVIIICISSFADNEVRISLGTEAHLINTIPFNFYWKSSLAQSIYSGNEINYSGTITKLSYYNDFNSYVPNVPIQVWLGETDKEVLSDGWISSDDLILVYDGYLDFPFGNNEVVIELQTPYEYQDKNLVILTKRCLEEEYYTSLEEFKATPTGVENSSRYLFSDDVDFDTKNPNEGETTDYVPNVTLTFNNGGKPYQVYVTPKGQSSEQYNNSIVNYSFTIHNIGTQSDSYYLSAHDNQWTTTFWFEAEREEIVVLNVGEREDADGQVKMINSPAGNIREINQTEIIRPGASQKVNVRVNIPASAINTDSVTLRVQSVGDPDVIKEIELSTISLGFNPNLPHAPVDFIAEFEPMQGVFIRYPLGVPYPLIKDLSEHTTVYTFVANENIKNQAITNFQNNRVNLDNCVFLKTPTDSYWTRDYSPWFVRMNDSIGIVDFQYNRPRPNDNKIPLFAGDYFGLNVYELGLYHTGGNMMADGMGKGASSDLVLSENSNLSRDEIGERMNDFFGIDEYFLQPDPTGSPIQHIDTWAKFLAVDKIMIRSVPQNHSKYHLIEATANYFSEQTSSYGTPYQIIRISTPQNEPYTNSLIVNDRVYVPLMNTVNDQSALETFRNAMPGYEVVGYTGNWLSDDALHCRTYGVPDLNVIHLEHIPLNKYKGGTPIPIQVKIQSYGESELDYSTLNLHWKKAEESSYNLSTLQHIDDNYFQTYIPAQEVGQTVYYYFSASNTNNKTYYLPLVNQADPFKISITAIDTLPSPQDVQISIDNETITLSWEVVPQAESYIIEESEDTVNFVPLSIGNDEFIIEQGRVYWHTSQISKRRFYRVRSTN